MMNRKILFREKRNIVKYLFDQCYEVKMDGEEV